jgi:hypothetical protein
MEEFFSRSSIRVKTLSVVLALVLATGVLLLPIFSTRTMASETELGHDSIIRQNSPALDDLLDFTQEEVFHKVTFSDWNGITLKVQDVANGSAAEAPPDPSREGFMFKGWNRDYSKITADLMVRPVYKIEPDGCSAMNYVYLMFVILLGIVPFVLRKK